MYSTRLWGDIARKALIIAACICILVMAMSFFDPGRADEPEAGSSVSASYNLQGKAPGPQDYATGEILVKFKAGASEKAKGDVLSRINAVPEEIISDLGVTRIRIPSNRVVQRVVEELSALPFVEYAEPNYMLSHLWNPGYPPNDPLFPEQWHLDNDEYGGIGMKAAWDIERGDPGVVVAVVDTGVAYENHQESSWFTTRRYYQAPDLAQTSFVLGYDFVNNNSHANDDNGHGTHVAGTIAQSTNNGIGVAGVAPGCSIMPVKVLNSSGSGTAAQIANGITFAADNGADIINMSLGTTSSSSTLENAVRYAYEKGVTIVCAAGNNNAAVNYPAAYDAYCIAVGATKYDDVYTRYSCYGASLDLVAPGGDNQEDLNGDGKPDGVLQQTFNMNTKNTADFGYYYLNGTSMASPHVAGVAALVISRHGLEGRPDSVRNILQATAKDLGAPGWDERYGHGLVNAAGAVNVAGPGITGISPSSGKAGMAVTITGYLFGDSRGLSSVSFGTVKAADYGERSDSRIEVKIPEGLDPGEVGVTVTRDSVASDPFPFLVSDLGVTAISPSQAAQGTSSVNAQVSGFGFASGASVKLQAGSWTINASNVSLISDARIDCTFNLTGAQAGTYDVVVSLPDGKEAGLAGGFQVTASSDPCGTGSGFAALALGLMLGMLSAAGSLSRRKKRRS